jgi:hypothetical protein
MVAPLREEITRERMPAAVLHLAGAGDAAPVRGGEGDSEPRASRRRALELRGGGCGVHRRRRKTRWRRSLERGRGWRRTGGGGALRRAGRRGGCGSAAGRGRRWQAVRPAVAAGAERVLEYGGSACLLLPLRWAVVLLRLKPFFPSSLTHVATEAVGNRPGSRSPVI